MTSLQNFNINKILFITLLFNHLSIFPVFFLIFDHFSYTLRRQLNEIDAKVSSIIWQNFYL